MLAEMVTVVSPSPGDTNRGVMKEGFTLDGVDDEEDEDDGGRGDGRESWKGLSSFILWVEGRGGPKDADDGDEGCFEVEDEGCAMMV